MEDYILREINKIGVLLDALLKKLGLRKQSDDDTVEQAVRTELLENLDLDIDALLDSEDLPGVLVASHNFSDANLEQFAELLFDLTAASDDRDERIRFAAGIGAIYTFLDAKKAPASLNRYYILKELKDHIK